MAKTFTSSEWAKINKHVTSHAEAFGLPARRNKSIVIGSFNIRKLGKIGNKSPDAWALLETICSRYDLLGIQEVQDDLEGLRHLKSRLGDKWGLVVTDTTGKYPGDSGLAERLAFLFRWDRISRTELASDITYDRSRVVATLFEDRAAFAKCFKAFAKTMQQWEEKAAAAEAAGNRKPSKPTIELPRFVTFIRTPQCVSFQVETSGEPLEFLAVNAHLLYGEHKAERRLEFEALLSWILERAKHRDKMYYPNMIVVGDMNLDFEQPDVDRPEITERLKGINDSELKGKKAAALNLPFLDVHPGQTEVCRTNARHDQTFDQVIFASRDPRLPSSDANDTAGSTADGYDFGCFDFADLFAQALHGKDCADLTKAQRTALYAKFENDLTDHMPIWVRLPI